MGSLKSRFLIPITAKDFSRRFTRLATGLVLVSVGVGLTVKARLGISPFDVLNQGVSRVTGWSFGLVVIVLGVVFLLMWIPLGQRYGIGTFINTATIGLMINATLSVVATPSDMGARWAMLLVGLLLAAFGMGLYISAGLGPGPRDGLMTGITAKGFPLWLVRTSLEILALAIGWWLGGDVGIGTIIFAFAIGPLAHIFIVRFNLGVDGFDPNPRATLAE